MILSMGVLVISTYALILLHSSVRDTEGIGSLEDLPPEVSATWSNSELTMQCSAEGREGVWSSLPACLPRNVLVSIPFPPDPDLIQYIPREVEVPRCAGTCYQEGQLYHRCSANETEVREVPIILERISGKTRIKVCTTVRMEIHTSCKCGCEREECSSLQEFNNETCECRCKDTGAMGQCLVQPNKMWDSTRCSCRCTAEQWRECNTGYTYDGIYTCRCLPGPPIIASTEVVVTLAVFVILLLVCVVGLGILYKRALRRPARGSDSAQSNNKPESATESERQTFM